jgi:hypothetical protein
MEIGYEPSLYLKEAQRRAKGLGKVMFADDGVHKLAIANEKGQIRRFGRVGYDDHLIAQHKENKGLLPKGTAEAKRQRFHKSHEKIRGDWKSDAYSPNNLALQILW